MKTPRFVMRAAFAALLLAVAQPALAQDDSKYDPSKLVTPPMHRIPAIQPERFALANGIAVYLLEDHELPVVAGTAYVKTSPVWFPKDKVGLGRIAGRVIRSGGSAAHGGDWLDDRLAAIGASMSSSLGIDQANAGFRCLSDNTGEVVGLFAEILQKPAFPEDKIELAKVELRREIAGRNDEMIPLLIRVAQEAVYGEGSPYAPRLEYATVEAVTRDDCIALHGQAWEPSRVVLAVCGDFKSAEMKKLLAARFGAWQGGKVALPTPPPLPENQPSRLVFAPKEDVTQSGIIVTHVGFRADDPDYPPMDVLQMALGGGFQSRMVNEIRSKRGLAYATGAAAGEGYQRPGLFLAYSLTKSESTLTALRLVREEVRKVTEAPFTAEELKTAKESVLNTFVFNFEQPSSVLFRAAFYEVVGYPQDFLQRYQQALEAITAESVLEAARRKVHPDQMVAVVVGKEKDFDGPLTAAGLPVERKDITIPPPPSKLAVGEASSEALAKGQAWLRKAAELAGGSAAWGAIKTVSIEQEGTVTMQGQSMSIGTSVSWELPGRMLVIQKLPMGEMKQGCDGSTGWMSMMGQVKESPKVAEQMKEEYEKSLFRLFAHPDELQVQALDSPETIEGVAYSVAFVKSETTKDWTLYFTPDGWLARTSYQGEGPMGPARQATVYSDWKPEGQVQYPRSTTALLDDQPFVQSKVTGIKINPALGAEVFKKPAQ